MPSVAAIRSPLPPRSVAPSRLAAPLLWLTLGLVLLLVLAYGGVQPQWYLPVYAALFALAAVAQLATGNWQLATSSRLLDLTILAFLLLPWIQIVTHRSVDAALGESAFVAMLGAAAAFWTVRAALSAGDTALLLDRITQVFAAIGGILGFEAILQLFLTPDRVFGLFPVTTAVPMGPFVDRDHFAACMGLLLPFALVLITGGRRRARGTNAANAAFAGLCAVVMLAAIVVSISRGGMLAAGGELVAFAIWEGLRSRNLPLALAAAAVLLAGAVLYAGGYRYMAARLSPAGLHDSFRVDTIRSSLSMGAARPLLGWGLGSWDAVYPQFARFDDGLDPQYAHCEYAQLFAEAGVTGLVLFALFALALGRAALTALPAYPRAAMAAILALGGYAFHAGVDFVFHIPGLLLLAAVIAALAAAPPQKKLAPQPV